MRTRRTYLRPTLHSILLILRIARNRNLYRIGEH